MHSNRVQMSLGSAGNLSEYILDDKSVTKLKKYYGHKKDRTKKAPKENHLTTNSMIDNTTRLLLLRLINNGFIDAIGGNVQTGKEGTVLSAVKYAEDENGEDEWFCLKVYKVLTMEFRNKKEYIYGDHRFVDYESISGTDSAITKEWTRREHYNLKKLFDHAIPCPEPILYENNVLLMRMIGEGDIPALNLKQYIALHAEEYVDLLNLSMQLLRNMFQKCKLIHGDFSEYNLLVEKGTVWVIDVGQAVNLTHGKWEDFLRRDIYNILHFFDHIKAIPEAEMVEKRAYDYVMDSFEDKEQVSFLEYL